MTYSTYLKVGNGVTSQVEVGVKWDLEVEGSHLGQGGLSLTSHRTSDTENGKETNTCIL